jgi:glycosyltransferase involved in cell wall biosynthesis
MNNNFKIGLFIDTYYPNIDGVVVVVDNYAKNLQNMGNSIFVGAPGKEEHNEGIDYNVYRCKEITKEKWVYSWPMAKFDRKFKKRIKEEKPDIIHIHSPFGVGRAGLRLAKKLNIPVVATMHSQFHQDFYKATKSKIITKKLTQSIVNLFERCDEVFVMNESLRELLVDEYGYTGKTRIVPNATDMDYPKDPKKLLKMANSHFNLKEDEPVFLFVGRLIENKGIVFMAEVIRELKDKGLDSKMVYVGTGPDEDILRKKVEELSLEDNIIMAGKIMDRELLASIYLRADLFLFPSIYDTDGLVRKEAGANKTPSILARGTLASNLIVDNDTGFLADFEVEAFAKKVYEVMNDKELLAKVGENTYTKDHINWEKAVKNAESAYIEIIENRKNKK